MIKTRHLLKTLSQPSLADIQVRVANRQVQWLCDAAARSIDSDQESFSVLEYELQMMLSCFEFSDLVVEVKMDYDLYICTVSCGIRTEDPWSITSDWHLFAVSFVPPH